MTSLKDLKRIAEAATQGEWFVHPSMGVAAIEPLKLILSSTPPRSEATENNCQFIAAANPQTVLKLIAKMEKLVYCVEFYAEKRAWGNRDMSNCRQEICDSDLQEFRTNKKAEYIGGKFARKTLADFKKEFE